MDPPPQSQPAPAVAPVIDNERKGGVRWDPRDGEAERVATCAERAGGDCERDSWSTSMERLLDHRFFVFSSNLPIHIFLQMLELF